jgi:spectinomycin phosphotransferase
LLDKPDLQDERIIARLEGAYGLHAAQVAFLPLGADQNTAVYRVVADDGTPYFLKLRSGVFDETSVTAPAFLRGQGIAQIISPVTTRARRSWARLDGYRLILYPFVEGQDGYERDLSDRQRVELGAALRGIHTAAWPPGLLRRVRRERYAPQWREVLTAFLAQVEQDTFDDPVAAETAAFLRSKSHEVHDLIARAGRLGSALRARSPEFVLCHSDLHAGNLLLGDDGALYIVDWDEPIMAPKERDLMFIGAGVDDLWPGAREEALFYEGYGPTEIDPVALAYYRYERIVADLAVESEQVFLTTVGGADRANALHYMMTNFLPDNTIERAYRSDKSDKSPARP